jgi:SAM-dependent methyltransferase
MTPKKPATDTDWHDIWQRMMSKCSAIDLDGTGHLKQWSVDEARDYLQRANTEYPQALIDLIKLDAEDIVLDVGCGPGVLALPFSKLAKTVTAVDLSLGMLEVLRENAKAQKLENIVCVNKFWRDVRVGVDIDAEYDVVISSNSINLLAAREQNANGKTLLEWSLVDAVAKMNQVGKRVYLTFHLSRDSFSEVFQVLGREYNPWPNHIILHNVLYQMGIRPNFSILVFSNRRAGDSATWLRRIDWLAKLSLEEKETVLKYLENSKRRFHDTHQLWGIFWWSN